MPTRHNVPALPWGDTRSPLASKPREVLMRKHLIATAVMMAISGLITTKASSGTIELQGGYTQTDLHGECIDAGGTFSKSSTGYSCKAKGGTVSCDNHGTCTGTCSKCGTRTGATGISGILGHPGRTGTATGTGSQGRTYAGPNHPGVGPVHSGGTTQTGTGTIERTTGGKH